MQLLVQAEHDFEKVQAGLGNATRTVADLSEQLTVKEELLVDSERSFHRLKSGAQALKKVPQRVALL